MRGLVHWSVCLSGLREFCAPTFERKYSEGSTSELVTSEHHQPLSARLLSALYMNKRTLSACGIPRSLKSLHRVILTLRLIFLETTRATTLRIGALDSFFHYTGDEFLSGERARPGRARRKKVPTSKPLGRF